MSEVENEKDYKFIKIITIIIIYSIIGIIALFTLGVSKVDASELNIGTCNSFGDAYNTNPSLGGTGQNISWNGGCLVTQLYYNTNIDYYNVAKDVTMDFRMEYTTNDAWTQAVNYVVRAGYITISGNNVNFFVSSKCSVTYTRTSKDVSTLFQSGKKRTIEGYAVCKDIKNTTEHAYPAMRVFRDTSPDTTQGHYVGALSGRFYTSYSANATSNSSSTYNGPSKSDINNNFNSVINNNNANTENIINNNDSNTERIIESNSQTKESVDDLNDTINDSSVDNPNSALNGMNNYFGSNGVISDLLLLPVRMFQSIVNTIDGTCSPFNLGSLFGHQLSMPCINLSSRLGSSLYGVIDVLICGFFILTIRKKFVDIFEHFTSLKMGGNELE